jgi:hypothetical protein
MASLKTSGVDEKDHNYCRQTGSRDNGVLLNLQSMTSFLSGPLYISVVCSSNELCPPALNFCSQVYVCVSVWGRREETAKAQMTGILHMLKHRASQSLSIMQPWKMTPKCCKYGINILLQLISQQTLRWGSVSYPFPAWNSAVNQKLLLSSHLRLIVTRANCVTRKVWIENKGKETIQVFQEQGFWVFLVPLSYQSKASSPAPTHENFLDLAFAHIISWFLLTTSLAF